MEHEIKIINEIVIQAIKHGADDGGSYDNNEENLINVLNEWIKYHNLSTEYIVKTIEIQTKDYWDDCPQIIKCK